MISYICQNAIQTPDGTILASYHTHDFKSHKDRVTGKLYFIDGGADYRRMTAHKDEIDLGITSRTPFEEVREKLVRGTKGVSGDEQHQYIFLKDMEEVHIAAVLDYVKRKKKLGLEYDNTDWYIEQLEKELNYRNK